MSKEKFNKTTGEIEDKRALLNQIIIKRTQRPNGTWRIQQDFSNCPTMAEQHTAHLTDINYLIKTYKPDELAAYLANRAAYRKEILGHDFSQEPDKQEALNQVFRIKQQFENLDPKVKENFRSHMDWLKFIDNPANQEKMIALGFMTKQEVKEHTKALNNEPNEKTSKSTSSKEEK